MRRLSFLNNLSLNKAWYFLMAIVFIYILLAVFKFSLFLSSCHLFYKIFIKIIPAFLLVFVLMGLTNYFITPQFITRHLKGSGIKHWLFVILGGILSSGPIYMWYPFLAELKSKGLDNGSIACFLYNRAIKLPLLPVAAVYFSWQYIIILTLVMVVLSVFQAILINKLLNKF